MDGVIFIGADAEHMVKAPLPESIRVTLTDAGTDARTLSGRLVRQSARRGIRELTVVWKDMPSCAELLELLGGSSFVMRYPDPVEGGFRTAEFYCTFRDVKLAYSIGGVPHTDTLSVRCAEV